MTNTHPDYPYAEIRVYAKKILSYLREWLIDYDISISVSYSLNRIEVIYTVTDKPLRDIRFLYDVSTLKKNLTPSEAAYLIADQVSKTCKPLT